MRRRALIAGVLGLGLLVAAPGAQAAPPAPTFSGKTDGVPVPLVTGAWTSSGPGAGHLAVKGLAANGAASSFHAEWTSPAVAATSNKPVLTVKTTITLGQLTNGTIQRVFAFRLYAKGTWTKWFSFDVFQDVPVPTAAAQPVNFSIPVGKLVYLLCRGCPVTVATRYDGVHTGTLGFTEEFDITYG